MDICEKIAYIKGLADGLDFDKTTSEGKILTALIDLMEDVIEEICEIEDGCDELMEQVDEIDEDLSDVEELLYDDEDDEEEYEDDDDLYEIECPSCHDIIYLDGDMIEEDGMACPNCGTKLIFDFDGVEETEEEEDKEDE